MRKLLNTIKDLLILTLLLGLVTAGIDYTRLINGEMPLFNIKSANKNTHIETFRGLFYIAERKYRTSTNEPLTDSTRIKYKFLTFNIKVPKQFKDVKTDYKIHTEEIKDCNKIESYYKKDDLEINTYCLKEIKVITDKEEELNKVLENNQKIIDIIVNKLGYMGYYKQTKILYFKSRDNNSFTNNGLAIYMCNNKKTYYIGPKDMEYQENFCK